MKVQAKDIEMVVAHDPYPDLSWLQTDYYLDDAGNLFINESMRYSNKDVKTHGSKQVLQWIKEDHERENSYGVSWWSEGIKAGITLEIPVGKEKILHRIESPGIWGVESDSDDDHKNELFEEEKRTLIRMLEALGAKVKD